LAGFTGACIQIVVGFALSACNWASGTILITDLTIEDGGITSDARGTIVVEITCALGADCRIGYVTEVAIKAACNSTVGTLHVACEIVRGITGSAIYNTAVCGCCAQTAVCDDNTARLASVVNEVECVGGANITNNWISVDSLGAGFTICYSCWTFFALVVLVDETGSALGAYDRAIICASAAISNVGGAESAGTVV
jgi:hypothetical protein